ncbi:hypothetical protein LRP30_13755 [Bradyrhizobium sp. C-145]|uniref:hypothetical protein n=1 Tax=Bradyrhizobium sp. C-145 TaxID=574727 RepID=UPI00201B8684|nr:hypothetical protein [Bradyrhizobium sp. C-145]UQR66246.1 hypothetical protein LRP30_13755 [Bradyrhizobium sp. C-145]
MNDIGGNRTRYLPQHRPRRICIADAILEVQVYGQNEAQSDDLVDAHGRPDQAASDLGDGLSGPVVRRMD